MSDVSEETRTIMGDPAAAKADLIAKAREWRTLRQPRMDSAAGHRKVEALEHEVRFRLANAALLWLWHEENPRPADTGKAGEREDSTCYVNRSEVRQILLSSFANDVVKKHLLEMVDALPIFTAADFQKSVPAHDGCLQPGWQSQVMDWAVERFGDVARNPKERAFRFAEEALELGQSQGLNIEDAHALVRRVYSRDPGEPAKEIGQCGMTLEALAFNIGHSVSEQIAIEIDRIQKIPIAEWQRRHAAKIAVGAALPAHDASDPDAETYPLRNGRMGRDSTLRAIDEMKAEGLKGKNRGD